jgi:lysophospholipase L1-like esterase
MLRFSPRSTAFMPLELSTGVDSDCRNSKKNALRLMKPAACLLFIACLLAVVVLREQRRALGSLGRLLRSDVTENVVVGNSRYGVNRSTPVTPPLSASTIAVVKQEENPGKVVFRHRILCYGDSLTHGDDLALGGSYPYPSVLHHRLRLGNPKRIYQVYSEGRWGWAAEQLHNETAPWLGPHGSITNILRQSENENAQSDSENVTVIECAPISLVIILIGTNDVNRCDSTAEEAFDHIRYLHQDALYGGSKAGDSRSDAVRTIAVEIPGSIHQLNESLRAEKAASMNAKLAAFASTTGEPRTTFMPFPFAYVSPEKIGKLKEQLGLDRNDHNISTTWQLPVPAKFWSADGVHLSPPGYEQLAISLLPVVEAVLTQVERDCKNTAS